MDGPKQPKFLAVTSVPPLGLQIEAVAASVTEEEGSRMSGGVENFSQPIFHNQNQAEATLGMISLQRSLPIDAWVITQVAVSALLAFLVYHILKYSRIKGPTVWPVLGTTPQFLWNLPRMHDWTTDMLKKYDGTYTSIAPKCTCLTAVATCRFLPPTHHS